MTKFSSLLELGNFSVAAEIRKEAAELKKGQATYTLNRSARLVVTPGNATLYDGMRSVIIMSEGKPVSHDFTPLQRNWLVHRKGGL